MKRQPFQSLEDSFRPSITFFGKTADTTSLNGDERKLARDEEGVDEDKECDEGQAGRCTNESLLSGSVSGRMLTGAKTCHTPPLPCPQEVEC